MTFFLPQLNNKLIVLFLKSILILVVACVFIVTDRSVVVALSQEQKQLYNKRILWHDIDVCGTSTEPAEQTSEYEGTSIENVDITAYSPQAGGDTMEGGYPSSRPGPDGKFLVRTLDDIKNGESDYVTIAADPFFYEKVYVIPSITFNDITGKSVTLKNVRGFVHDTGSAFTGKPEGRFDIPVGKDYPTSKINSQPYTGKDKIKLIPVTEDSPSPDTSVSGEGSVTLSSNCSCSVNSGPNPVTSEPTDSTPGTLTEYPDQVDRSLAEELKRIGRSLEPNLDEYKAAASRWGIPWQAIAATHWREGSAGSNKSMVNGTTLPTTSELNGREYIWGSADARIKVRSHDKSDIPIGNGGAQPRRFYGSLTKDVDYATWLLIQHGTRTQFGGDDQEFIKKAQDPGLTKEEWTNTWSAYLGGASAGYGSFGRDTGGRMGAGAIMAFFGGLVEKPPAPSVTEYPGKNDSDYDKVASGVDGTVTEGSPNSCNNVTGGDSAGIVNAEGYAFPIAAKRKSDYDTFGALSAVPCNNPSGCHHDSGAAPNGHFAFDLGVKGYGPDRSQNAPVYAISDGVLTYVNHTNRSTCNSVTLTSSKDNFIYWYGHLRQDFNIKTGTRVKAGDVVGHVGNTHCADQTAPHLHISRVPPGMSADTASSRDRGIIEIINKTFEALPD